VIEASPPELLRDRAFSSTERVDQCDLCGSNRIEAAAPESIVACIACGYRFVSPRPTQQAIADSYSDPTFYDTWLADDAGRKRMWQKRLDIVRRFARGPRLLDVGAGIGTFIALARDTAGWDVLGTEVSSSAIETARRLYKLEMFHGPAEDLPLEGRQFDSITLWHVLEHVPSPLRMIRFCRTALTKGGTLVIAVPNDSEARSISRHLRNQVRRQRGRPEERRYEHLAPGMEIHLSHFSEAVLRDLLKREGFRVRLGSVDDHHARPSWRTDLKVLQQRAVRKVTGLNTAIALLLVAERQ
jgi:ubiquinone/menaquinone biosynthesis C-methylase UbiE